MGKYKKSMFDLSTSELFRVGWFTEEECGFFFLWQSLFTSALDPILQDLTLKANLGRHTLFHRARVPNFVLYWGLGTKIVTQGTTVVHCSWLGDCGAESLAVFESHFALLQDYGLWANVLHHLHFPLKSC